MFSEIRAIFSRHYLLQNTAMEVFMANRSEWEPQLLPFRLCQQLFVITRRCDTSSLLLPCSVGHVQLPRPGDGEEGDLQSSSSGSGHQLRPPAGQVGRTVQPATSTKPLCFAISSRLSLTWPRCVSGPVCSRSFEVPLSGSLECECALTLADLT